ncbi:hypothetical protein F7725_007760 [Dissostichus mawsoni]|uniref:Uncharacterized protein n=1 Tax=Dissostichus mawsoni TaxID=36200 RepID=A0A7J5Y7H9_DISMA|nr:hypothetical protein F7725_007760 [Dissostichus mawsoni]
MYQELIPCEVTVKSVVLSVQVIMWVSTLLLVPCGYLIKQNCLVNYRMEHLASPQSPDLKKRGGFRFKQSAEIFPPPWTMYQDYSGNYDTSSRGSSTSPAQQESFTSGSSTIGSPISTSSYQEPDDHVDKPQRSVIKPICLGGGVISGGMYCTDGDSLNTPVVGASTPAATPNAPSLIFTYPSMLEPESPSPSSESCSKAHRRSSSSGDQSSDSLNSPTLLAL